MIKSFVHWDIYYLYEYAKSFEIHGDGEPYLIFFQAENIKLGYVVMQRDIAESLLFANELDKKTFYDWETPYGYGGPLVEGYFTEKTRVLFEKELFAYCKENGVISQFIRFHPVLQNQRELPCWIESKYLKDTIVIDTDDTEQILKNMDSKNRNMVKKAQKNGVSVISKPITEYSDFLSLYYATMERDEAREYYYFTSDYFRSLENLEENCLLFYALMEQKTIGGAIIFYNDEFAHYHLSGSDMYGREYAAMNLLLYEVACWAAKKGIKRFHLGGGLESEDNLFAFKKKFNKEGRVEFWVGRTVFEPQKYKDLCQVRKKLCPEFDTNNNFMIQYRR